MSLIKYNAKIYKFNWNLTPINVLGTFVAMR